jgi:hypothetical protein
LAAFADPLSSAGGHIGSEDGDGNDNDTAPGAEWLATYSFDAAGWTYKVLLRGQQRSSDSFWARITAATAQTHEDPDQPAGIGFHLQRESPWSLTVRLSECNGQRRTNMVCHQL